jgi:hypothetical protein
MHGNELIFRNLSGFRCYAGRWNILFQIIIDKYPPIIPFMTPAVRMLISSKGFLGMSWKTTEV